MACSTIKYELKSARFGPLLAARRRHTLRAHNVCFNVCRVFVCVRWMCVSVPAVCDIATGPPAGIRHINFGARVYQVRVRCGAGDNGGVVNVGGVYKLSTILLRNGLHNAEHVLRVCVYTFDGGG